MITTKMKPEAFREILKAKSHWICLGSEEAVEAFTLAQLSMMTVGLPQTALKIDYINAATHYRGLIIVLLVSKTVASVENANSLVAAILGDIPPTALFSDVQDIAFFPGTDEEMIVMTDFLMGINSGGKVFNAPVGAN